MRVLQEILDTACKIQSADDRGIEGAFSWRCAYGTAREALAESDKIKIKWVAVGKNELYIQDTKIDFEVLTEVDLVVLERGLRRAFKPLFDAIAAKEARETAAGVAQKEAYRDNMRRLARSIA